MKKILLLVLVGIVTLHYAHAQVIDVVGKGVKDEGNEPVLTDPELSGSIDKVVVEAYGIFHGTVPTTVTFSDADESYTVDSIHVETNLADKDNPDLVNNWYKVYYSATFSDVDAGGIKLNKNGQGESIIAMVAYIYRPGSIETYSILKQDHAFMFQKEPLVYNFPLNLLADKADITVTIPFADLQSSTLRWAMVNVTAGSEVESSEFQMNNQGNLLRLETLELNDVPKSVTNVEVEIISPTTAEHGKEGDSFITGLVSLLVEEKPGDEPDPGCTYTQGYWKTHSEYGPAKKADPTWDLIGPDDPPNGPDTPLYPGGDSWIDVFRTSVSGNPYYNLAHQFMAAKLNLEAGASSTPDVDAAISAAEPIIEAGPGYNITTKTLKNGKVKMVIVDKEIAQDMVDLASTLTDYNEGLIGPGHCDDMEEMEKSAEISPDNSMLEINDLKVYPNPVTNSATISFNAKYDGNVTVDLYNSLGQRTSRLMDRMVERDFPVTLSINSRDFHDGLYILRVQNESSAGTARIQIGR